MLKQRSSRNEGREWIDDARYSTGMLPVVVLSLDARKVRRREHTRNSLLSFSWSISKVFSVLGATSKWLHMTHEREKIYDKKLWGKITSANH